MMSIRRTLIAAALCFVVTAIAPVAQQAPGSRLIGFSPTALSTEREAEARFMAGVSTDAMSAFHRSVTRRPHMAGSAGSMEVAETVRSAFVSAGLETEVREYHVLLSTPKSILVELVAPVREALSVAEDPSDSDPDSKHPDLGPGLAEAIRLRDQPAVNREMARIEAALTRLLAALDRIVVS